MARREEGAYPSVCDRRATKPAGMIGREDERVISRRPLPGNGSSLDGYARSFSAWRCRPARRRCCGSRPTSRLRRRCRWRARPAHAARAPSDQRRTTSTLPSPLTSSASSAASSRQAPTRVDERSVVPAQTSAHASSPTRTWRTVSSVPSPSRSTSTFWARQLAAPSRALAWRAARVAPIRIPPSATASIATTVAGIHQSSGLVRSMVLAPRRSEQASFDSLFPTFRM